MHEQTTQSKDDPAKADICARPASGNDIHALEKIMKRKGNTGIWTFVIVTGDGKVLARSEWGTNYEFDPRYWESLPIIE